jgi:hypothetical protein
MGSKNRSAWTKDDDNTLRRLWSNPRVSSQQLSVRLCREFRTIRRRALSLSLPSERFIDKPVKRRITPAEIPVLWSGDLAGCPGCGKPTVPTETGRLCINDECKVGNIPRGMGLCPMPDQVSEAKRNLRTQHLRRMQESA